MDRACRTCIGEKLFYETSGLLELDYNWEAWNLKNHTKDIVNPVNDPQRPRNKYIPSDFIATTYRIKQYMGTAKETAKCDSDPNCPVALNNRDVLDVEEEWRQQENTSGAEQVVWEDKRDIDRCSRDAV